MDFFFQQLINGLSLGSLYALIAVGYTVVYGIVQLINFAHGEIFMVGAFGAFATWMLLGSAHRLGRGRCRCSCCFPLMILGGVLASVRVALLTERFAYRPLRNAPRLAPLISAIGVSVFLQEFVRLFYGQHPRIPGRQERDPVPGHRRDLRRVVCSSAASRSRCRRSSPSARWRSAPSSSGSS